MDQQSRSLIRGTAFERGKQIATLHKEDILQVYQNLSEVQDYQMIQDIWEEVATEGMGFAKKWAPTAFAEIEGMASVEGLSLSLISKIIVHYELERGIKWDSWASHHGIIENPRFPESKSCTGLTIEQIRYDTDKQPKPNVHKGTACTSFGILYEDGTCISGQNNDEDPDLWTSGDKLADFIFRLASDGSEDIPDAFVYTHAGYPAKMGINSCGLSVMSLYIENNERNLTGGVPFACIQRELLTKKTIEEAFAYLSSIPRCFTNCFVMAQYGKGIYTCECTPSAVRYSISKDATVHGNQFALDLDITPGDKGFGLEKKVKQMTVNIYELCGNPPKTKFSVEKSKQQLIHEGAGRKLLEAENVACGWTISSMVFVASESSVRLEVKLYDNQGWKVYTFL